MRSLTLLLLLPIPTFAATSGSPFCRVTIETTSCNGGYCTRGFAHGSGTLVDCRGNHGLVLTNWHVVEGAKGDVTCKFRYGETCKGQIIRVDKGNDIAAIRINRPRTEAIEVERGYKPNGALYISGFGPTGRGGGYRTVEGRVVRKIRPTGATADHIQVSTHIREGDSGGGIWNKSTKRFVGLAWGCNYDGATGVVGEPVRVFLKYCIQPGNGGVMWRPTLIFSQRTLLDRLTGSVSPSIGVTPVCPPTHRQPVSIQPVPSDPLEDPSFSELLQELLQRVRDLELRDRLPDGTLQEILARLRDLEERPQLPGPPGEEGPEGPEGPPGPVPDLSVLLDRVSALELVAKARRGEIDNLGEKLGEIGGTLQGAIERIRGVEDRDFEGLVSRVEALEGREVTLELLRNGVPIGSSTGKQTIRLEVAELEQMLNP